jgi:transcriptional regulator with XRE-family HTH domain
VTTSDPAIDRGTRRAKRHAGEIGDEIRERRLASGLSQTNLAETCRLSRGRYRLIELGQAVSLTILELDRIAAVLGLDASMRLYPGGPAIRDVGQLRRLRTFLGHVAPPLSARIEVALPTGPDRAELRAWDAVVFGLGTRTAIELEMRLRDVQALVRRIDLKRRDDPTEGFLLLIADTRGNRRILAEFAGMLADLPRLRPSTVYAALERGEHPATGIELI